MAIIVQGPTGPQEVDMSIFLGDNTWRPVEQGWVFTADGQWHELIDTQPQGVSEPYVVRGLANPRVVDLLDGYQTNRIGGNGFFDKYAKLGGPFNNGRYYLVGANESGSGEECVVRIKVNTLNDLTTIDFSDWRQYGTQSARLVGASGNILIPVKSFYNPTGTRMYVMSSIGSDDDGDNLNDDFINAFSLSTPWDIQTAQHLYRVELPDAWQMPQDIIVSPNGVYWVLFVPFTKFGPPSIVTYRNTTAWDFRTAVEVSRKEAETALFSPVGVDFSPDGRYMLADEYFANSISNPDYTTHTWYLDTYEMPTYWDVSTMYRINRLILYQETVPNGDPMPTPNRNVQRFKYNHDGTMVYSEPTNTDRIVLEDMVG